MPNIKLRSLDSIKFTNYEVKVTEDETKKRINDIAKNQNNFKEVEGAKSTEGDLVIFDYKATIDKKEFKGGAGKNLSLIHI